MGFTAAQRLCPPPRASPKKLAKYTLFTKRFQYIIGTVPTVGLSPTSYTTRQRISVGWNRPTANMVTNWIVKFALQYNFAGHRAVDSSVFDGYRHTCPSQSIRSCTTHQQLFMLTRNLRGDSQYTIDTLSARFRQPLGKSSFVRAGRDPLWPAAFLSVFSSTTFWRFRRSMSFSKSRSGPRKSARASPYDQASAKH